MYYRTTEEKQREKHYEHRYRSEQRTRERLADSFVNKLSEALFRKIAHIFPYPVKYDYGVVNRITYHGQKRGNDRKSEFLVRNRYGPHGYKGVVKKRDNRSHGKTEFKPYDQISQYADARKQYGENGLGYEFLPLPWDLCSLFSEWRLP